MKGTVFDIRRFSIHDGPGIRTAVFLKGCPLSCLWCQNPEGRAIEPTLWYFRSRCIRCGDCVAACRTGALHAEEGAEDFIHIDRGACAGLRDCVAACPSSALAYLGEEQEAEEVMEEVLKDRLFYEESAGGITLTGGDPLYQAEFSATLLAMSKAEGLHTAMETCLFAPTEELLAFLPLVDLFMADLKIMDPSAHLRATGVDNSLILANFAALAAAGAGLVARVPLIPGYTATEENLRAIGAFVRGLSSRRPRQRPSQGGAKEPRGEIALELLNFNPLARDKYRIAGEAYELMDVTKPYSEEEMDRFRSYAEGR